jgi:hypothetical protein
MACIETGCTRPVRGRGLCGTHYAFHRRHGTLPALVRTEGCSVEGCNRKHEAHGLCALHYARLRTNGTLAQPRRTADDVDRFWAFVCRGEADECWLWTGSSSKRTGYGLFWLNGKTTPAHRVAYTLGRGQEIPEGLAIDHICCVRLCQNPAHLRPLTTAENNARLRRSHCKHGHEMVGANIYIHPQRGSRQCRTCRNRPRSNRGG